MPHQTTFLILLNLALYARKKPKVEWTFIDNYNIMFVLTNPGLFFWIVEVHVRSILEILQGFERYVFFYPLELAL